MIQLLKSNNSTWIHTSSMLDFDVGRIPSVSITMPESDVGTLC